MAGARLAVTSRLEMLDAAPVALGEVTTNSRGGFIYTPAAGASRAITFAFADTLALRTATVTLSVIPAITVRVTRAGVSGRVAGAPPGVRKLVELQSQTGHAWRTFATTRLAPAGGAFSRRLRVTARAASARVVARRSQLAVPTGISPPATRGRRAARSREALASPAPGPGGYGGRRGRR